MKKERLYILKYSESKNKYAIVEKGTGIKISNYFDDFYFEEFSFKESDYYKAIDNGRQAIFHKNGKQVTKWHERIANTGILTGESKSKYLVISNEKQGIFDIFNRNFFVGWYDRVGWQGILNDKSSYCIVYNSEKYSLVNEENNILLAGFDWIFGYGILEGKTNCFIGQIESKIGIFDLKGHQITQLIEFTLDNLENLKLILNTISLIEK